MATQADVRNKALEELGVIAAGESASAEDAATVDEYVGHLHEEYVDNGLVAFTLASIPSRAVLPMAILAAAACWRAFNGEDGLVQAEQKAVAARARLARQAQHKTDEPVRALYF